MFFLFLFLRRCFSINGRKLWRQSAINKSKSMQKCHNICKTKLFVATKFGCFIRLLVWKEHHSQEQSLSVRREMRNFIMSSARNWKISQLEQKLNRTIKKVHKALFVCENCKTISLRLLVVEHFLKC